MYFFTFVILQIMVLIQCDLPPCPVPWQLPCHLPPWPPTYKIQLSTQHFLFSSEGYYDKATVTFTALHGIIGISWGNYYSIPMHREETEVVQVQFIKAANPKTHVFIYCQSQLALNIYDNGAKVMYDPSKVN